MNKLLFPFIKSDSTWFEKKEAEMQAALSQGDAAKVTEIDECEQKKENSELAEAEERYIESFSGNPDRIFQDFQETIDHVSQSKFEKWFEFNKKFFPHDAQTADKWAECCVFISKFSAVQLRTIEHYGLDIQKALRAIARKAAEWYEPPELEEENRPEIRIAGKKTEYIICLLDKVSRKTFEIKESGNYPIAVESRADEKDGKEITVFLYIDFSGIEDNSSLKISKPLTPYDQRVYNVICSLWKAENHYITIAQIYRRMERKTGAPNAKQAEKIRESIEKMARIIIEIDNRQEAGAYNYPHFQSGRTYLLPSESITDRSIEMNGKILDYCLFLYREPPLLTYAEAHKQITKFTPEQAALPDGLSTTEDNLQLDDYLKFRISRNKTYGTKILFKTLHENCGIKTPNQRSRATTKIRKLLTHYKTTNLIKDFKEHTDGITFVI